MIRISLHLAVATAVATAVVGATLASPASAQELSPGCLTANSPLLDEFYNFAVIFPVEFAAGDRLRLAAEPPFSGSPTTITLEVDNTIVDTAQFPGRVGYVFPAAGTHSVTWFLNNFGNATFTVGCRAAAAQDPLLDVLMG